MNTSQFSRLSARTQHGIVHQLGWRNLRPVQELSLGPVLEGENLLILAPTAGGKTEAAMLPIMDALARRPRRGVRVLYLSPLKALLNNQEPRLQKLAGLLGLSVFKWHGDVGLRDKKQFAAQPSDVLMLTPESLEGFMLSRRHSLLAGLEFVVVDEIHAFAGDDRGDHLLALLERLSVLVGRDFQRLGLSATVGNPDDLLSWLCGSSGRPARVVRPPSDGQRRRIEVHAQDEDQIPGMVRRLASNRRSLLFTESRSNVERLKAALQGVSTYVHHGSLAAELRLEAERAFASGLPACILCTSTLELGIDVGDLDLVLQVDPPPTVSAFLQRLGRSGRRSDTIGHMALLTDRGWGFLQAVALVRLAVEKYVEPVMLSRRSPHVFVHQVLSRVLAERGVPRPRLVAGLGRPGCFDALSVSDRETIIDHLVETRILTVLDGRVMLGEDGERRLGRRHFETLYAVFEAAQQLEVRAPDERLIGHLDAWFAQAMKPGEFVFLLGGRAWQVVTWDWDRRRVTVVPAPHGQIPTWQGGFRPLGRELCQAVRDLLVESGPVAFLHPAAQQLLDELRTEWQPVLSSGRVVAVESDDEVVLYTFAGGRINQVYGRALQIRSGRPMHINNFWVSYRKPDRAAPNDVLYETLEAVRSFGPDDLRLMARSLPPTRLSKFQPYLPPALELDLLADRVFDLPGAVSCLEDGVATVQVVGRCAAQ